MKSASVVPLFPVCIGMKSASVVPSISCVHFTPSAMLGNPVDNWIILISLSHRKVETYLHDLESQERSYKLRKRADTSKPMSNNLLILDTITIYLTHKNNFFTQKTHATFCVSNLKIFRL